MGQQMNETAPNLFLNNTSNCSLRASLKNLITPDDREQMEPCHIAPFKNLTTVVPKSYDKMPTKQHRNHIHALNQVSSRSTRNLYDTGFTSDFNKQLNMILGQNESTNYLSQFEITNNSSFENFQNLVDDNHQLPSNQNSKLSLFDLKQKMRNTTTMQNMFDVMPKINNKNQKKRSINFQRTNQILNRRRSGLNRMLI